jgi:hypothetical protein
VATPEVDHTRRGLLPLTLAWRTERHTPRFYSSDDVRAPSPTVQNQRTDPI